MNATIAITGIELTASNLSLPESSAWFDWYYERDLQATGTAVQLVDGVEAGADEGAVVVSGTALHLVSGQEANLVIGEVNASGAGLTQVDGLEAQTSIGEVSATAVTPVDATTVIEGITLNSALSSISANAVSAEILRLSGNPIGTSFQVIDGFAKTKAIEAKITIGKVNAFGLIVINGGAVLQSVSAVAQVPNLQANGVLGISEEELVLFLMAA